MGALNCCIDCSVVVVVEHYHSPRIERQASLRHLLIVSEEDVEEQCSPPQEEGGDAVEEDQQSLDEEGYDQPDTCKVATPAEGNERSHAAAPTSATITTSFVATSTAPSSSGGRQSDTFAENYHQQQRRRVQRRSISKRRRVRWRSQSLGYAALPSVHLSDYLCACDSCPISQKVDHALQFFVENANHPMTTDRHRGGGGDGLGRVLRACATYNETQDVLDQELVQYVDALLDKLHGDEDKAFCFAITHMRAFLHKPAHAGAASTAQTA